MNVGLRKQGVVVGGSYGRQVLMVYFGAIALNFFLPLYIISLAGRVLRIGHMGTQANEDLVLRGMQALAVVITQLRKDKECK